MPGLADSSQHSWRATWLQACKRGDTPHTHPAQQAAQRQQDALPVVALILPAASS